MSDVDAPVPEPGSRLLPPDGWEGVPARDAGRAGGPEPFRVHAYPADEAEAHLRDYWQVLVRRRWTVVTAFLAVLVTGTVLTFTTRPVYTGTAVLRIEREAPKVLEFEEVVRADPEDEYYQTQYRILQSRSLANRVIGLLALDRHPEFRDLEGGSWLARARGWARERVVRWLPVPPPSPPETADDLVQASPLTEAFAERLTVRPVRNARLVEVAFESHHPDLAARVANTLADAFIAQSLDQKVEKTRYATRFLASQMEEARARLEESEARLAGFLERNDILLVGADGGVGQGQDLVTKQLTVLSDALLRARAERIAKESAAAQAATAGAEALPAVLGSPVIGTLKERLVTLEGEYQQLGHTFKPEYPRMQRLAQHIVEVRRSLEAETRRIVEALEADYRAALRTEQELERAVDRHRGLALRLGERMVEYRLLRRDVDTNQGIYTSLLTRLKETGVSSSLLASNISVVDRAEVPLRPSKPKKGLSLALSALLGLVAGVGLAVFREYLDTTIKNAKEVEAVLRLPTLAVVPSREALLRRRAARRHRLEAGGAEPAPFALVAHAEMGSLLAEAFRNLRTSLLYSAPDHPPRTIMVTSLAPGDGKTSLATNLAIVLAQLGMGPVLLVDGDMRRPRLHELLEVPQVPGLSTFLTGQAELAEVVRPTRIPNLAVIPSGRVPLNPAELMSSARLREAMGQLAARYVHVVFDAPPLFGVSDAVALAPKVEGVVLVLRHGRSGRDAAQRAVVHLDTVRARLLGVILNDVDIHAAGAGDYGYYGYYGYHGYRGYAQPGAGGARVAGA